jgi:hypothetical protein
MVIGYSQRHTKIKIKTSNNREPDERESGMFEGRHELGRILKFNSAALVLSLDVRLVVTLKEAKEECGRPRLWRSTRCTR